eukprot:TRINITY_DN10208_c0_g1_i1.p1 TRINITY_DN10208_c0_g1~~TRINITY_DN10208_c0_g1_i1.p1  ORF type:complete len:144 (-),score=5.84 TRINITY_DN10208_c0_g1_i1:300-731(-)
MIFVTQDTSLIDVVQVLSRNRILSCPILNQRHQCLGLVDVLDVLVWVLTHEPSPDELASLRLQDNWKEVSLLGHVFAHRVNPTQVANCSGLNVLVEIKESEPSILLFQALALNVVLMILLRPATLFLCFVLTRTYYASIEWWL